MLSQLKSYTSPEKAFKFAMEEIGLFNDAEIICDGALHRFYVEGDRRGSKNGFYIFFGGEIPAGYFGCWKRGISKTWCALSPDIMTKSQREAFTKRIYLSRLAREREVQGQRETARNKASAIWEKSVLASVDHPYLVRKRVKPYSLRTYNSLLVVPMRDALGVLHSLQFIDEEGNKRFLSGGRKQGCYFSLGNLTEEICIAEGYATAASIHEATGLAVAVAFDSGNLAYVAQNLRKKFLDLKITICADNDVHVTGNPGLTKAKAAASLVGAYLAIPPCAGDFNDLINGVENE